jgi:hypothetical protein
MLNTVSCVATSLQKAEELLDRLDQMGVPAGMISCFISERQLDEDRILGRIQFEYVNIDGRGRFFVAGPVLEEFKVPARRNIRNIFQDMGCQPEVAAEYEEILEDHHILILVHCADRECAQRIRMGFRSGGAYEIYSSDEQEQEEAAFA